ncbi:MAG: GldG family protein [Oscillospiraceae bacterium]|nr:GldG family protein [Oscillospiraceae bacterium]
MAENETEKQETVTEPSLSDQKPAEQPAKPKKKVNLAARKKLKYGGIATAITCIVTAAVIGVNVLVSRVVEKYPLKIDLTETGMYEISDESRNFLQGMTKDVNFTVLMSETNFNTSGINMKMVSELLDRYAQYSDKVHLSYVDPTTHPDVVNNYQQNYSGTLQEGDIIVSDAADDSKMRVVSVGSLFSYDQQKLMAARYYGQGTVEDAVTGFSGEQNLTAALLYVTDANPVKVGFIDKANGQPLYNSQFHGYAVNIMATTLAKNGYDVQSIDLYKDQLDPSVYDMLILPAPVNDLTATAVDSISAFLFNDGSYDRNLIYVADFTQGKTPKIDELLGTWGVEVTRNLALEGKTDAAQQVTLAVGPAAVPLATVADTAYAEGMANDSLPIVAPLCRPITLLWESRSGGITSALLKSSETVYLNEMGAQEENPDKSPVGAQNVMAMTTRSEIIDNVKHSSNIMVLGSMMLLDPNVMQDAAYNNASFFISASNTMNGKGAGIVIAEKQLTSQKLTMSAGSMRGAIFAVFVLPMLVAVTGVVVIMRRRNK